MPEGTLGVAHMHWLVALRLESNSWRTFLILLTISAFVAPKILMIVKIKQTVM